jgi:hypothetical protein
MIGYEKIIHIFKTIKNRNMKKIVLFMAVGFIAITEYAKAGKLPLAPSFISESASHKLWKETPTDYQAFLKTDWLYKLSSKEFKDLFIAAFNANDPDHEDAMDAFTPGALDQYVILLSNKFGKDFGLKPGELLTDDEVAGIMSKTTFTTAPKNLKTKYKVARLPISNDDNVGWFSRDPYYAYGENIGSYNGKPWILDCCGNVVEEIGGTQVRNSTTRRPAPSQGEDDNVYTQAVTRNVNINRNDNGGGYNRDQRIDVNVENTRSNEMTDWEKADISYKKKANSREWVNTGTRILNTGLLAYNTIAGVKIRQPQNRQVVSNRRVVSRNDDYYSRDRRVYDNRYDRPIRDRDFQGGSPSGSRGRYASNRNYEDEYYDDEYYDDGNYDQGYGGNSNTWGNVARVLNGDRDEDLRMYSRSNYVPSGSHNTGTNYRYTSNNNSGGVLNNTPRQRGRGTGNVLRN